MPDLLDVLNRSSDRKVQRAALTSIAMLPDAKNRDVYARYLKDKDERLRAAAAEGFARLKNPADLPMLRRLGRGEENRGAPFAGIRHGDARTVTSSPNSARCSTW